VRLYVAAIEALPPQAVGAYRGLSYIEDVITSMWFHRGTNWGKIPVQVGQGGNFGARVAGTFREVRKIMMNDVPEHMTRIPWLMFSAGQLIRGIIREDLPNSRFTELMSTAHITSITTESSVNGKLTKFSDMNHLITEACFIYVTFGEYFPVECTEHVVWKCRFPIMPGKEWGRDGKWGPHLLAAAATLRQVFMAVKVGDLENGAIPRGPPRPGPWSLAARGRYLKDNAQEYLVSIIIWILTF
jgi:hypothetical protein